MAYETDSWTKDCYCYPKCKCWARFTSWSCGCVTVEVFDEHDWCDDCSDFRGQRRNECDDNRWPSYHK